MRKLFTLLLLLVGGSLFAQFRISTESVDSVSAINDSTYTVVATFNNDITGSAYYPDSIRVGHWAITQKRQVYRVDSLIRSDATTAKFTLTERDVHGIDTEGPPIQQLMIFDLTAAKKIPSIRLGSGGLNVTLFEAIQTFNSMVVEGGAQGEPGPPGAAGDDGQSAYQIWLAAGNTGTVQDYLNDLVGPAGADGVPGANGTPGIDGVSVTDADIQNGDLILTLSDASTINAGALPGGGSSGPLGVNLLYKEIPYAPTVSIQYDSVQPNSFITLAGDLSLSIASAAAGAGEVDIRVTSDTQRVNLAGEFIGNDAFNYTPGSTLLLRYELRSSGTVLWFNRADPRFVDDEGILNVPELRLFDPDDPTKVLRLYIAANPDDAGRKAMFVDPHTSGINSMAIGTNENQLPNFSLLNVSVVDDVREMRFTGLQEFAMGQNRTTAMPSFYRTGNNFYFGGGPSQNVQFLGGGKLNFAFSSLDMNNRAITELAAPSSTSHGSNAAYVDAKAIVSTHTYDPPSIAAQSTQEHTVTISGVTTDDFASVEYAYSNVVMTARVTAAGQVTIRITNYTATSVDPPSADMRILVNKASNL